MNENFLQYIAEQMAHLKFGEDATKFNEALDKYEFTAEVQEWINLEVQNLKDVEQQFDDDKPLKLSGEMIEVPIEEETIFFWDDFNNSRKKK